MVETVLVAIVLLGVSAALVYPLFRPPLEPVGEAPGPAARLAALEDRKEAIYGSIRDLGHDLRMDKLTGEDYRLEANLLKRQAVEVLAEIESLAADVPRGEDALEARIAALRAELRPPGSAGDHGGSQAGDHDGDDGRFCTECGRRALTSDRFCAGCGTELRGAS